jgi:hypothetical protein
VQKNDPPMLVQEALEWQLLIGRTHSLMSKDKKTFADDFLVVTEWKILSQVFTRIFFGFKVLEYCNSYVQLFE